MNSFGQPRYGITRRFGSVNLDDVQAATVAALAGEGFGVLTEIDVQATLARKLGVEGPRYRILGACNPALAHRAFGAEPGVGLLLPCNVVVTEDDEGVVVSAVDPVQMLSIVGRADLEPLAAEVRERLARAVDAIRV